MHRTSKYIIVHARARKEPPPPHVGVLALVADCRSAPRRGMVWSGQGQVRAVEIYPSDSK